MAHQLAPERPERDPRRRQPEQAGPEPGAPPWTRVLTLEASGNHLIDGLRTSDPATYRFQVVPEPATLAMAALGAGGLWLAARRRNGKPS